MKIKRKTFVGGIIATLCACTALTFGAVFNSSAATGAEALAAGANDKVIQLTLDSTNLAPAADAQGKMFSGEGLAQLYDEILGTTYANTGTYNKVEKALTDSSTAKTWTSVTPNSHTVTVPNAITADDIRTRSGHNIQVKIGKTAFEVVYVTLDNSGEVIVTLWQAESTQKSYWAGDASGTAGSSVNTNRNNNATTRPGNVYGNSFIRAKMLGQGGTWDAFSGGDKPSSPQSAATVGASTSTVYAALWNSMTTGNLAQYIDTPLQVKYQEIQSYSLYRKATASGSVSSGHETSGKMWWAYTLPGDAYGVPFDEWYACPTNYYWNPNVNTAYGGNGSNPISGQDQWKNDKIWLPSITETGHNGIAEVGSTTYISGLWGLDNNQRRNDSGSTPSTMTQTSDSTSISWLRSGLASNTQLAYGLGGSGENRSAYTSCTLAVRPALHLNLKRAAAASGTSGADYETVNIPQSGSITYNAKDYTKLSDVVAQVKTEVQTANPSAADPTLWYEEGYHKLDVGTASSQYLSNSDSAVAYKVEYTQQGKTTAESPQTSFKIRDAGTYKITCKLTDPAKYRWRDPSDGSVDADGTKQQTFNITVKQAELKYTWANDSSMTGASWSKDFDKSFIDGNPATGNAPWVYLDYTLLNGDSAKDTDTSGGAGGTVADNKYPYIVLKFVEKVNTYGDADITADNVRTRITNTKGTNYPKEAQTYTVTFTDSNKDTGNYKLVPDTGESASRDYTINKKKITAPSTLAALEYSGTEQSFNVTQYDSGVMEYGTLAGTTFTAAATPTDMTAATTSGLVLKATKVGKYKVAFRPITSKDSSNNDVIRNYEWQTNATGSNVLEVEYEIKAKTLEFDFVSSADNGTFTIKTDTTGKVTVSFKNGKGPVDDEHGNPEAVEAELFYYYDTDGVATAAVNPGATWNEISFADLKDNHGVHNTGDYTIGVRLKSGVAANANYTIDTTAAATYTKGITINAGEAGIDDLKLTYKDSTMGSNDPLQPLTAGDLKYALDSNGDPVAYFPQLDFDNTIFEMVGTPTYTLADGSNPSFAGGLTAAGKVTVTVGIRIKANEQATNKMPANGSYKGSKFASYDRISDTEATVTFEYTIDKMEIDTSVFKLQYSYDQSNWKDFATAENKVEFASATIYVRIDPTSLAPASAGISVMFGTKQYAEGKNKGSYTAGADFTLTNNDNFAISSTTYNWEITNKQINVTNWVPGDFKIDGVERIGEIMVINGHKDLYDKGVIEYVYTWSAMDGTNGSGTGETELAKIFAVASPTNQVTVTATVQLKAGVSGTYDLSGATLTSLPFAVGDAKSTATITNAGSAEYGSVNESAFGVKVEADGENLPATNPLTQALLYEVYLHDYDGLSVDNVSGDGYGLLSNVDYSALNAGKYVIEVRLTAAGAQDYAPKGARQLFEITPKKVVVPQVTKDIVFNGTYINLADYLDNNYNADIMSMLSGYTNKLAGSYTVTFKLNNTNYMWVEPTTEEPLSNKLFAKAVLFADGISIDNSALTATLNWTINKIVLSTDGWNLNSKDGVSLNALAAYQEMITANELDVAIGYRYYDTNGNLVEEPVLKGGDKYIVEAYLTGADAINFEFADGTDAIKSVSAQKEYTVPQSGFAKLMGSTVDFLKANWLWLVIAAVALLLLILLICLIVAAKKKKRKKEELEEQRRLEKEEREKQEREERRREDREERMARMNQQQQMPQMMMPQMMPQMMQMPQMGGQSMSNGGASSNELAELKAEVSALRAAQESMRAEQTAKELAEIKALHTAEQQVAQAKTDMRVENLTSRLGGEQLMSGGLTAATLAEIVTAAMEKVLDSREKPAAQTAPAAPESNAAAPVATQVPPDAVMTTVTTTKIDTTKKPAQPAQATQTSDRAAPAGRTIVRNFVAPMPVDDGRVFDVGGFYTPADPVDLGVSDEETDKKD
ncbi:MAG: hypothetical protein K2O44_01240 [Clostridia bacterium]|nr:hypothetical protein [Clostridia bacterium]